MGVVFKSEDAGVIKSPKKKDDTYPKSKEDSEFPGLMPRSSDYHKEWYARKCKGGTSFQRDKLNKYHNEYHAKHKERINAKRRKAYAKKKSDS